ncbi:MAG: transglutaminase family protein [Proteobacteria bacterium]|nr:transglutaminase family protein [Pseudomonadota bacterium]
MIFMLRPRSGASQWVRRDEFTFSKPLEVIEYVDGYGNLAQRLVAPQGDIDIHSSVDVETPELMDTDPNAGFVFIESLPEGVLGYLVPTRYCESERFSYITQDIIGGANHGYQQVSTITEWIRNNIEYRPMDGEALLSAEEVRQQGHGVCRDLAHLGIAMCRSISIPSRLVVGYLLGLEPMTLHAWFEAYVGNRWYAFDPSQKTLTGGRIVIAYGRDSADVPVYHLFGPLPVYSSMDVTVSQLSD